jgi:hydrogenase maturation protein HypF
VDSKFQIFLARILCERFGLDTVVLSGGVFQNELLLQDVKLLIGAERLDIWANCSVPPNDGGISLGQAALAALAPVQKRRTAIRPSGTATGLTCGGYNEK